MPDRRRHFLSGLLALAAAGPLAASPATEEKLKAIMQAAAARPPDAERLREREALLREAEAALAAGDAQKAEQGFDRAALILHSADTEMGLVRSYMQSGQYRRALAFGAHTAGAHLDVVGGAALYAWLLHAGGQDAIARKLLADAQVRAPSQPLVASVGRELASGAPHASGDMLLAPARLAPYSHPGHPAALPRGARLVAAGTLVDEGRMALVPAQAVAGGRRLWVRNGLGQLVPATAMPVRGESGVALLRLGSPLPAPSMGTVPADVFPGAVAFAVAYAQAGDAGAAWPLLRTGFVGAATGAQGDRELDVSMHRGLAPGGPVFDQSGRLAGIALPEGAGGAEGGARLVAAPRLRAAFAGRVALPASSEAGRLGPDAVYEAALRSTLQVIAAR
ncbi:trypsin-like peptidase domain-containing protein [Acidovorax sp. A1169]|uniref:trypsin-like peptidase domain-containing protein n=1 Tax=Acidovorax sp. A1169 TaxID=3059524 RepID=UPI002737BE8F|nr:trypsin-like peptidase domain-containing protein [Acidovorax sp. A1169]MDP4077898.1 hypothetical protein [Acidovorax sp. A1169]